MGYRTYTCPVASACGGCEWLAVPYPIQLERKQTHVEELLGPMASEDKASIEPIRGMDEPVGYRHKITTPFAPDEHGRILFGLYRKGSHEIIACKHCLTEDPQARKVLAEVVRVAEKLHIPAYSETKGTGVLRHATLRTGYATDESLLVLVTNVPKLRDEARVVHELHTACPSVTSIVQNINTQQTNAILGDQNHVLYGAGLMHDRLLGCTFEIGPTSFYQTNPAQTEILYQAALEAAALTPGMSLLDAYCGTGTIGVCAAAATPDVRVTGVERVEDAVTRAAHNAAANGVNERCTFVAADAAEWLGTTTPGDFDVIVMDPPRAGCSRDFLEGVVQSAPARIIYISCNPTSQARDLGILREHGYRIQNVLPVDMFPHTKHVETVVSLVA